MILCRPRMHCETASASAWNLLEFASKATVNALHEHEHLRTSPSISLQLLRAVIGHCTRDNSCLGSLGTFEIRCGGTRHLVFKSHTQGLKKGMHEHLRISPSVNDQLVLRECGARYLSWIMASTCMEEIDLLEISFWSKDPSYAHVKAMLTIDMCTCIRVHGDRVCEDNYCHRRQANVFVYVENAIMGYLVYRK